MKWMIYCRTFLLLNFLNVSAPKIEPHIEEHLVWPIMNEAINFITQNIEAIASTKAFESEVNGVKYYFSDKDIYINTPGWYVLIYYSTVSSPAFNYSIEEFSGQDFMRRNIIINNANEYVIFIFELEEKQNSYVSSERGIEDLEEYYANNPFYENPEYDMQENEIGDGDFVNWDNLDIYIDPECYPYLRVDVSPNMDCASVLRDTFFPQVNS